MITIIVMLILVAVTVTIALNGGLFGTAKEVSFVTEMRKYQELTTAYVVSKYSAEKDTPVSVGLIGQDSIKTVIPDISKEYEDQVIVQGNKMYYKYNETKKSKQRVEWCFKNDIPVWGYDSLNDFNDDISEEPGDTEKGDKENPSSDYIKVGNIYMHTPDLSNMNPEATYYVTYDSEGKNETIHGRIDRVDAPENWYNYEEKKWANIVTVTNDQVAYWVWIPRYAYKTDSSTQTVDAKFISKDSNTYLNSDGNVEEITEYKVPEAFNFGGNPLPGYWMAKYEASGSAPDTIAVSTPSNKVNEITVSSHSANSGGTEKYNIYLDGVLKKENITLPYTFTDLRSNKKYDICVTKNGQMIGRNQITTKSIKPNLSGLNPECTYYITYDENGENMRIANRIDKGGPPDNWCNYAEKRWGNIVVISGNKVSYWVWIPRYRYSIYNAAQITSIEFIDKTVTNDTDSAYIVPEAFTVRTEEGNVELDGFWISKYEISDISTAQEIMTLNEETNSIKVSTTNPIGNYRVYKDGEEIYTGSLPYTIGQLNSSTEYDIMVCKEYGEAIGGKKVTTAPVIEIDLTGLNQEKTFYVYWDENGVEHNDIPISSPAPNNWYNYAEKRWANIVTKADDTLTYWVYIPRYEYNVFNTAGVADVRFIPKTKTTATDGYQIPDAFRFAEQELAGYWVSKYEVNEKK